MGRRQTRRDLDGMAGTHSAMKGTEQGQVRKWRQRVLEEVVREGSPKGSPECQQGSEGCEG